ncbi:hypothetical protein FHR24_002035 [Wenyingzhuangia heitensis]|uniref:Uncharacterized protein n=1 Tax=Wenyingzhuangia heitensis TaxID=1487859 RepID=A0ABX0U9S8_9FLAO|nr:hypothetical protein [Wenyingzhuangia heitensis]NIJ45567.1 hypothetical protein [Wenyingzhuangia heitensis]
MDLENFITVGIILFICITPFVIMSRKNAKKEKEILQLLENKALEHKGAINIHEHCNNITIGLDTNKQFLFFLKSKKEQTLEQFIDLSLFKKCEMVSTNKPLLNPKKDNVVLEKIELVLTPIQKNETILKLEMYHEEDAELRGEYQLAKKWVKEINHLL